MDRFRQELVLRPNLLDNIDSTSHQLSPHKLFVQTYSREFMTWKSKSKTKSPHFVNSAKELLSKQFSNSPLMIMEATLSKISCFLPPNPPAGLLACLLNPYWRAIWTCLLASLRPASPFCLHCMCTSNSFLPGFLS